MRILIVNAGSSSVKLSVSDDVDSAQELPQLGAPTQEDTHRALRVFMENLGDVDAVGHRIVHGGPQLHETVVIDAGIRKVMEQGAAIAPLHVPSALSIVDFVGQCTRAPQFACFDTAFHHQLPPAAFTYAIPQTWRDMGVRRYGFHGLSCTWALHRTAEILGSREDALQIVVAHLGAGSSVTAIRDGHSVDTTMGFTPLEGVVMATRSGSVDPGALMWLQTAQGVTPSAMSEALEHQSGMVALAGTVDFHLISEQAHSGNAAAVIARDVYVRSAAAGIAAMASSLQRVDAVVFTGGIGEHEADIRARVCERLSVIGVRGEMKEIPGDCVVSPAESPVRVLVVHAREDLAIAREVRAHVSI